MRPAGWILRIHLRTTGRAVIQIRGLHRHSLVIGQQGFFKSPTGVVAGSIGKNCAGGAQRQAVIAMGLAGTGITGNSFRRTDRDAVAADGNAGAKTLGRRLLPAGDIYQAGAGHMVDGHIPACSAAIQSVVWRANHQVAAIQVNIRAETKGPGECLSGPPVQAFIDIGVDRVVGRGGHDQQRAGIDHLAVADRQGFRRVKSGAIDQRANGVEIDRAHIGALERAIRVGQVITGDTHCQDTAANGDAPAEPVAGRRTGGHQDAAARPGRAAIAALVRQVREQVHGTLVVGIIIRRADGHRIAAQADGGPKVISGLAMILGSHLVRTAVSSQAGREQPGAAAPIKDEGRALIGVLAIVIRRARHNARAVGSHRRAELLAALGAGRNQARLKRSRPSIAEAVNIRRARAAIARRAQHRHAPAQRHAGTHQAAGTAGGWHQFGLLAPDAIRRAAKDIG